MRFYLKNIHIYFTRVLFEKKKKTNRRRRPIENDNN